LRSNTPAPIIGRGPAADARGETRSSACRRTRHTERVVRESEHARRNSNREDARMTWTKPEFEIVEVTMEVTAYVARR
jgi:coenzyme PQQ precursor peptide PqqA